MKRTVGIRNYNREECIVFHKTKEKFGSLSNMASGFPIEVNQIHIPTSEALYQACRFPNNPQVQTLIVSQSSPMTAKMRSKPFRGETRPDWMQVRVKIMRWCLSAKLLQNFNIFSEVLFQTMGKPIVEYSTKDRFWGAVPTSEDNLSGANVLGRLLMELRESLINGTFDTNSLTPPEVGNFILNNEPIGKIHPAEKKPTDLF